MTKVAPYQHFLLAAHSPQEVSISSSGELSRKGLMHAELSLPWHMALFTEQTHQQDKIHVFPPRRCCDS